jgi:SulP family sulfate permease
VVVLRGGRRASGTRSATHDRDRELVAAEAVDRPADVDATLEHALLEEHIVAYRVDGALFFGAAQRFLLELTEIADVEVVILRLGGLRVLDSTGAQALADLIAHLQDRDITVLLASLRPEHRLLLQ